MSTPAGLLGRLVSGTLVVLGLGWIGYLVLFSVDSLDAPLPQLGWPLFFATVCVGLGVATNAILFHQFLAAANREELPVGFSSVLGLHFRGQLLRYLPGRLWGVVYQIGLTRAVMAPATIARANIDLMAYSLAASGIVASVVAGLRYGLPSWLIAGVAVLGLVAITTLFMGGLGRLLGWSGRVLPGRLGRFISELSASNLTWRRMLLISTLFLLSWVLYLAGWDMLRAVFPAYEDIDFIALGALYALASIVGIVVAVTPAGLGVREASFVLLSAGLVPPEVVAYFAVFGRIWLMGIELLLGVPVLIAAMVWRTT